jgi:hypothetical protein
MILDKSMIIIIVTGNNNMRHTIIIYNSDYTGIIILISALFILSVALPLYPVLCLDISLNSTAIGHKCTGANSHNVS